MINVILCGGSGTRLWPMSRTLLPKQFIKFFDKKSLFNLTIERNLECKETIIVCNENNYFLALDDVISDRKYNFILEPFGRNTAAAITMAALSVPKEEIILVTPSDHFIGNNSKYKKALKIALTYANNGYLVTFGVKPDSPNTGYGYIKAKKSKVQRFIEKPNLETAQSFLKEGGYFFNSGIFCFKASTLIEELKKYANEIYESCNNAFNNSLHENNIMKILPDYMEKIENISIDYALMQRSQRIAMVELDAEWSDLGNFDELSKKVQTDEYISINSSNNFIKSDRTVGIIDINDIFLIDTKDAIMVSKRGSSQKVKELYEVVFKKSKEICEVHKKAYRPWGSYEVLGDGDKFKIKRIIVKPHKRLSLQSHTHRSEHWVVVAGEATIQINDKNFTLKLNESAYIKKGEMHRLSNHTDKDLIVIEVQTGNYLGEDDIIRYNDDFKRN